MKTLVLIRGLPNSGKSTFAALIAPEHNYAADQFFEDKETGEYNFDPSALGAAHGLCQANTRQAMMIHAPTIAVHNTFTTQREMKPYLILAKEYGYRLTVITAERTDHMGDNGHGVPCNAVDRMAGRWQHVDPRLKQ